MIYLLLGALGIILIVFLIRKYCLKINYKQCSSENDNLERMIKTTKNESIEDEKYEE